MVVWSVTGKGHLKGWEIGHLALVLLHKVYFEINFSCDTGKQSILCPRLSKQLLFRTVHTDIGNTLL